MDQRSPGGSVLPTGAWPRHACLKWARFCRMDFAHFLTSICLIWVGAALDHSWTPAKANIKLTGDIFSHPVSVQKPRTGFLFFSLLIWV